MGTEEGEDFEVVHVDGESDQEEITSFRPSKFCALFESSDSVSSVGEEENFCFDEFASNKSDVNLVVERRKIEIKLKKKKRKRRRKKRIDSELDEIIKSLEEVGDGKWKAKYESQQHETADENVKQSEKPETASRLDGLLNIDLKKLLQSNNFPNDSIAVAQVFSSSKEHQKRDTAPQLASKLVVTRVNWPLPKNLGIRMILDEHINDGNDDGGTLKWFRFWHKVDYQKQQQFFWNCQRQLDFSEIMNVLIGQQNAYHFDSLLLLADLLYKQNEDRRARDLTERGIFACESVFHPRFEICSSQHRLNYAWRENRAFFLLLHRYMLLNIQCGNLRGALELAKLLFCKDPDGDPLGILLLIDSLALRARCPNFLLDFYEYFRKEKRLDLLPSYRFSVSLALHTMGMEEEAIRNFEEALVSFPFVLSQILDHLQIQADASVERNSYLNTLASFREPQGLLLVVRIFLHHSNGIWRDPATLNWLEMATHRVLPRLQTMRRPEMDEWAKRRKQIFTGLPENVARHCLLHDLPIPETLVKDFGLQLGEWFITDPCPPRQSLQEYLPEAEKNKERKRGEEDVYEQNSASNSPDQQNQTNFRSAEWLILCFLRSILPRSVQQLFDRYIRTLFPRFRGFQEEANH